MKKKYFVKRTGAILLTAVLAATTVYAPQYHTYSVVKAAEDSTEGTTIKSWNFTTGVDGWNYGTGWEYQYSGADNSSVAWDDGKLKATVDFSQDSDKSWSQMALSTWCSNSFDLTGANQISFDFYYDTSCMTQGSIMFKLFSNGGIDKTVSFDAASAKTVSGTIKKASITCEMDEMSGEDVEGVNDFAICVVGNETDYKGDMWFDNIKIQATNKETTPLDVVKQYTFDNSAQTGIMEQVGNTTTQELLIHP